MPAESPKCPACGAAAFDEASETCTRCGYASGEANRCPHCNAVARIEGAGRDAVCAVCGAPRVPAGFGGDVATAALKVQKKQLGVARVASITTVLQAIFAVLATLIGLAILPEAILGKVLVFAIAVAPLVLALRSRSRATAARAKAKAASEQAWQAAAEDVASRSKSGVTAAALAKALGIEADDAERLLTQLAVHDRTRIQVNDAAEVQYSVPPDPTVRVDASISDPLADEIDALGAAEAGAEAEAQADLSEEKQR